MNELTDKLLKTFKPRLAIIAYTSAMNEWQDCYLESHEMNEKGQVLEGKPLKQETLQAMVDVFFDERKNRVEIGGMIPENLLHFKVMPGGHYEMIWYRPAEKRQIYFAPALCIPSGKAWVPPLIYHVEDKRLSVFAFKNESRPDENEKLFKAPFHNTWHQGDVCLGNAKVKKPAKNTYANLIKFWEDMFWLSEFTHLADASNPTVSNLNTLWKKLAGKNIKWDMKELKPIDKKTLKDIL